MKTLTIKIDDELRGKLEQVAAAEQRTLSNTARLAIREGIERFFLNEVSSHPKNKRAQFFVPGV
jgi:predicted transcriptional regulator